jgi:S1-C subfamily serine protease
MRKGRRNWSTASADAVSDRAFGAVRPAVEAVMLAAVALGSAQAGWSVLTAGPAGASDLTDTLRTTVQPISAPVDLRSPFTAPGSADAAQSQAAVAALSGLEVFGVRMALDPARSAALVSLPDGGQRAVQVGQALATGLRLQEVQPGYIVVAFSGGTRQVPLSGTDSAAPRVSYAAALMGRAQLPASPAAELAGGSAPQPVSSGPDRSPFTIAVTPAVAAPSVAIAPASAIADGTTAAQAAALAAVTIAGGVTGVMVPDPIPPFAAAQGLLAGDVVTAVNGQPVSDMASVAAAMSEGRAELTIQRGQGAPLQLTISAPTATPQGPA